MKITNSPIINASEAAVDLEPWNKMPAETAKAYAAFLAYRNIPPRDRSLRKAVIQHYGKDDSVKLRQFQQWSSKFMWVDRADGWDQHVARTADEDLLKKIKAANEIHVASARGLLQKALERLKDIQPVELSPSVVLAYIQAAVNIERIALGEPNEIIKENRPDEESVVAIEMTDQELRQKLIALRMSRTHTDGH